MIFDDEKEEGIKLWGDENLYEQITMDIFPAGEPQQEKINGPEYKSSPVQLDPDTDPLARFAQKIEDSLSVDLSDSEAYTTDAKNELLHPRKQVVMSNSFIISIEEGSRLAHKISRIAIAQIPMKAKSLPITIITADDMEKMGLSRTRLTGHENAIINEILDYKIKILSSSHSRKRGTKTSLTGINVFSYAAIVPDAAAISIKLNDSLKEHFLNLRANFTRYPLSEVLQLPSRSASKLHELLLCTSRKFDADILRFQIDSLVQFLNYKSKTEFKPSTFVSNVIKKAVAQINEYTGLYVEYKPIKNGRSFAELRFYVDSQYQTRAEKESMMAWKQLMVKQGGEEGEKIKKSDELRKWRLEKGSKEVYVNLTVDNPDP